LQISFLRQIHQIPKSKLLGAMMRFFQIKLLIDSTRSFNIDQVEQKQNEAKIINPQYIIPSTEVDYWFIIEYENLKNVEIEQYFGFVYSLL